jgi:hypothetical protein
MTPQSPPEVRAIRVVKSDADRAAEVVAALIWLGYMYYLFNPDGVDRIKQYVRARWDRMQYLISVYQTRSNIENLPETDDPEV